MVIRADEMTPEALGKVHTLMLVFGGFLRI